MFDEHEVLVIKHNENIVYDYQDPMNGLWHFTSHDSSQVKQQSNMIAQNPKKYQNTKKHWCQYIKPMAPRHPRSYIPTFQQDLAIFYHHIILCPTKRTLIQEIPLKMSRSHIKTDYKVSPRVRNYFKRSPHPTKTMNICSSC